MQIRTCKLAKVAEVFNGKTPSQDEQRGNGFPVLKIKDISEDGRFIGYFDSFVSFEFAKEFDEKVICSGDTLILNAAHNADYVGSKVYFAEPSVVGSLPTGEWLLIRPQDQEAHPKYVNFWIQSTQVRRRIKSLVKGIHL
jgi:type I restriction enzyme, S subunit